MIDGTKRRLKFEDKEGDDLTLQEGSNSVELTLDQLSDADRALVAEIFEPGMGQSLVGGNVLASGSTPSSSGSSGTGSGQTRQWTNSNGKQIDAEYRGVEGEKVVLFFQNREWRVPLAQFSQTDQDWVAQQNAPASSGTPSSGSGYGAPSHPPQVAAAPATHW